MATIRQARAAIIKGAELAGWPKLGDPGVAEMLRGLGRILRGAQRQAAPLHAEALAAIRATAFTRRRTRGGHTETAEYARRRGLVDVASCVLPSIRFCLISLTCRSVINRHLRTE